MSKEKFLVRKFQRLSAKQLVSKQLNLALCGIFAAWIAFGLLPLSNTNDVAFVMMDAIFLTTSLLVAVVNPLARPHAYYVSAVALGYVLIDFGILWISTSGSSQGFPSGLFKDFLYSDKYFIYLAILGIFASSRTIEAKTIKFLLIAFLSGCLIKYGYSQLLRIDDRPKLLLENNYEQMMLLTLFAIHTAIERWYGRRPPHYFVALLVIVVALSGSRSALIALLPILVHLYAKPTIAHILLLLMIVPIVSVLVLVIFEMRVGASGHIDRVAFFEVFTDEVRRFDIWNYIIGMKPLSPLSSQSCHQLSYYQSLFSAQDNGLCYAPVLHSYMLRSFHDHGILGALLPFSAIFFFLGTRNYTKTEKLVILSIGFLCGFSVSGIGANFVAFPLALACGLRRPLVSKSAALRARLIGQNEKTTIAAKAMATKKTVGQW